jgi:hypothetical protein
MHVESFLSSLNELFQAAPTRQSGDVAASPAASRTAEDGRTKEGAAEENWHELIREVEALADGGGGRIVVVPAQPEAPIKSILVRARRKNIDAANLQPVRIVTDPAAPALQPQDVDHLYPWRQKDLVQELNTRLGRRLLNSYDIQAVRRHHKLDERPDFVFNLPGAGRRYSPAVADWIMEQHASDAEFFHHARAADQEMLKLRRQKPK